MTKFSTSGYTESSLNKVLSPNTTFASITDMTLEKPGYQSDENPLIITVSLEGPPLENFEGFFIDKNDESKGRHRGQVATVQTEYAFKDYTFKDKLYERDQQIFKWLNDFAIDLGQWDKIKGNLENVNSIEEYFNGIKKYLIGKKGFFTIAGKEYKKEGNEFINHRLFFPKRTAKASPYVGAASQHDPYPGNLVVFDPNVHIKKLVNKDNEDLLNETKDSIADLFKP